MLAVPFSLIERCGIFGFGLQHFHRGLGWYDCSDGPGRRDGCLYAALLDLSYQDAVKCRAVEKL